MKKKRLYWKFLAVWCVLLIITLTAALIWFRSFLKNYQKVFDETRPALYMEETMALFRAADMEKILSYAQPVPLCDYETEKMYAEHLKAQLTSAQVLSFDTKAGEHIEERPVYVVTADDKPFAVVRLKKQDTTTKYGLPLWELREIEFPGQTATEYYVEAPAGITLTVNGVEVEKESGIESEIVPEAEEYFSGFAVLPVYSRYNLGSFYTEPVVKALNSFGEPVELSYDENSHGYIAGYGGNDVLRAEMEEFLVQFFIDYAMFMSNDSGLGSLDKYFPKDSKLLYSLKHGSRQFFDAHRRPEIKNEELRNFTYYTENAISARVYLEQHMYVPYSGETEIVITDQDVYFVNIDGTWKVAGIAFR